MTENLRCGICNAGPYKGFESLRSHAKAHHRGVARTEWQRGFKYTKAPYRNSARGVINRSAARPAAPPPQPESIATYDQDIENRRVWPAASDRHNAENLTALPWLRYPTDRTTCEEVVRDCDVILSDRRVPDRAKAFFSSLRAHIAALGERLPQAA